MFRQNHPAEQEQETERIPAQAERPRIREPGEGLTRAEVQIRAQAARRIRAEARTRAAGLLIPGQGARYSERPLDFFQQNVYDNRQRAGGREFRRL